jgi:hypothetical protein
MSWILGRHPTGRETAQDRRNYAKWLEDARPDPEEQKWLDGVKREIDVMERDIELAKMRKAHK